MRATTSFPYNPRYESLSVRRSATRGSGSPEQRHLFEAPERTFGRRHRQPARERGRGGSDPQKEFSKALVTLLRFPNTNFTHLWDTRIEVHGQDMSVRLCEALELTESNVNGWRNPRPYEELKAMFDEIIAEDGHLNDNRRFRTCGHGLDTRVSATYGHGPTAFTSVRLS